MAGEPIGEVTRLLRAIQGGDNAAKDELFVLVCDELRRQADNVMRKERRNHTLQPTALVNEIYIRLFDSKVFFDRADTRAYFFGAVIRAMTQFLREYARKRNGAEGPGSVRWTPFDEVRDALEAKSIDVSDLDEALGRLEELKPRQYQVIALRFFGGMKMYEIARLLNVCDATVQGDYRAARAFLRGQLGEGG
jgi:RNA polymerase sigma factor (TIGR02999 family)